MNRKPFLYLLLFLAMLMAGLWIGMQTMDKEQKRIRSVPQDHGALHDSAKNSK